MESFDIAKWKKNFLNENTQEKYQVVFHDYDGDDVPYTEKFFDSESDAIRWAESQSRDYDEQYYDGNDYTYRTVELYYNPQEDEDEYGYHIETVAV
jgi:hypothetical protein